MGQMFNTRIEFISWHHDTTFYNSIKLCIRSLPHIFCFIRVVFYIFMWPISSDLLDSGWLLESVDLRHFNQVFDGIALKTFSHFFYVQDGKAVWFVKVFKVLLELIFLRRHRDKVHNNSTLYRYDNLYRLFFWEVSRKYWLLFYINPCGNNNMPAINCFILVYWRFFNFIIMQLHQSSLSTLYNQLVLAFFIVRLFFDENLPMIL